ncbi:hypothetical protein FHU36_006414 [Nonomuraea muscovyensis]|uniref:Streptomyces killer toxin-like beta/gamma crystallin domain-containing protein n=1 Tax=Nonomuraea muscovyensis TaxID=1124761 RepID=A0A7X0C7C2_9ACTN|nr:beta/gamma crystallin domain-containing protein [Nonomuraea muscovyensis]MBB6349869.1 hypothetical protein [Nonomuraea muscovyensis]
MRKRSATLAAAAFALGFTGLTATPALAIDNVVCRDGAGFTEIHNEKRHCFANAGSADVYIADVYKINAGNNNITIIYGEYPNQNHNFKSIQINKWGEETFNPRIFVQDVIIK